MLTKDITNLKRQITLTETKIKQKQLEIEEIQLLIIDKELAVREKQSIIGESIRALAERPDFGFLSFLLLGTSVSDVFGYFEQNIKFQEELHANIATFRTLKYELEEDRAEAEARKRELKRQQVTLADKRVITETQKKDQQGLLVATKNQEKRYQELLAETEKRFEEIQREIEELEDELRLRVDPTSLPPRREGFFAWPAEGRLSQGYGETPFVKSSHFYKFHNGIDIAASTGSDVVVADDGAVVATGNSDLYCPKGAYGKYIVIDHGNNLITMYAHLSLISVSSGQGVARGEKIGYIGSTGRSTGPHLHFTVYDARTFDLRQSKICGILPYGGSVNPIGYL